MDRVKGIDGLRAVAVLAVFAYHATPAFPGGWIGVDVFFVISGFVITRMLVAEYSETGKIHFAHFYLRRLLRLWPAMLVMVGAFTLLHGLPMREWLPSITYTANFTRMVDSRWDDSFPVVMGHTWSLAVEEQFYLIWPALLLVILRTRRPAFWIAMLALSTSIWRLAIYAQNGDSFFRIFNGLDTRADALMLGAIVALANVRWLARLWPAGIIVLCYMTTVEPYTSWVYLVGFPLIALAAASLVAHVASRQSGMLTRALEWRPIAGLGVISYAFYLWHYPILREYQHAIGLGGCLALTLLCAWASWILIERPIRNNRARITAAIISRRPALQQ